MRIAQHLKYLHGRVCEEDTDEALVALSALLRPNNIGRQSPNELLKLNLYASELILGARPAGGNNYTPQLVFLKSYPGDIYGMSEDSRVINKLKSKNAGQLADKIEALQKKCNQVTTHNKLGKVRLQSLGFLSAERNAEALSTLLMGLEAACRDKKYLENPGEITTDIVNIISLGFRLPSVSNGLDSTAIADRLENIAHVLTVDNLPATILGFRQISAFQKMQSEFYSDIDQARICAEDLYATSIHNKPRTHFELAASLCLLTGLLEGATPHRVEAQNEITKLSKVLPELPWCENTREFEIRILNHLAEKAVEIKNYDFAVLAYDMIVRLTREVFCEANRKTEDDFNHRLKNSPENAMRTSYLNSKLMLGQIHQERGDMIEAGKSFMDLVSGISNMDPVEFRLISSLRSAICFNLQAFAVVVSQTEGRDDLPPNMRHLRDSYERATILLDDQVRQRYCDSGRKLSEQAKSKCGAARRTTFDELASDALMRYRQLVTEPRNYRVNGRTVKEVAEENIRNLYELNFPQILNLIPYCVR